MLATLTTADLAKCDEFAARVVAGYAAGAKEQSRALNVPGKPAIYNDIAAQANGRLAELGFVRALGLSDDCLNWSDTCDGSYDVKLNNLTIDIKSSTHPRAKRLMWPVSKNHFITETADIFVFVKLLRTADGATAEICGWIGRHTFLQKAKISDGQHNIAKDTRYMNVDELNHIADLISLLESVKI